MELPSVRQLECLVAVAETLNFRRAAEACYITQPALSAQIQQLERSLGMQLFERDRRSVLPTPCGSALAERAEAILADLRDFAEGASAFRNPLSGVLKLGLIPTVAPYVLPRALTAVRRGYPDLRLLLREEQTERLIDQLLCGELDVLLMALEVELHGMETLPLFHDPFLLAVPAAHALAARKRVSGKDLHGEQVLLLDDGHCLRDQALAVCDVSGATEFGDFRASSLTTLLQMVAGGLGVTLIPELAVKAEAGSGRALKVLPFGARGPGRTIGLVWRPSSIRKSEYGLLGDAILKGLGREGR